MDNKTLEIVTRSKNGVIHRIENSFIYQPKPQFGGGEIKWYEDKLKIKGE